MSDPTTSAATTTGCATLGFTTPASTATPDASRHASTLLPTSSKIIYPLTFTSDAVWPAGCILDSEKGNWQEWDKCLHAIADQHSFHHYLNGTTPCPDKATNPDSAEVWDISDIILCGFILQHISDHDYEIAKEQPNSHSIYKALHDRGVVGAVELCTNGFLKRGPPFTWSCT